MIETTNCAEVRVYAEPMSQYSSPLYLLRSADNAEPLGKEEWREFMPMQKKVRSRNILVKKQLID